MILRINLSPLIRRHLITFNNPTSDMLVKALHVFNVKSLHIDDFFYSLLMDTCRQIIFCI